MKKESLTLKNFRDSLRAWILASRPKTLTAALTPVVAGTTLLHFLDFDVSLSLSLFAVLSAMSIQIATNLFNDGIDYKKGADTHERVGPQRVTQSGLLSYRKVMFLGVVFCSLAVAFAIPLVIKGGLPIVGFGLVSIALAYLYTGGPYPLAYKGLGDLFVIFFFGIAAVSVLVFIQTGLWLFEAFWLGLQLGCLSAVLIAINNLRDREQDIKANKKTLAVRFGVTFARYEILGLLIFAFVSNFYWLHRSPWAALLPLLLWPLAVSVAKGVFTNPPGVIFNKFLGLSALIHLGFGLLMSLGFMI